MQIHKLTSSSENNTRIILASILILFAVFSRLLPHPPNVAPIAAVALFGGAILPRKWALSLPLVSMVISDLLIGLHPLIFYTWGSFILIALLGNRYMKRVTPVFVGGASIGASLLFYLISNFGVWLQGNLYPLTYNGLVDCYIKALPFFRNTIPGDLLFTSVLFGIYALAYKLAKPSFNPFPQTSSH